MSLDQLLTRFKSLEVQTARAQIHNIHLNFPACDLLPERGTIPSLDPPKYAVHMSRPPKNEADLGLLDLNFHVQASVGCTTALVAEDGAHVRLLQAVDNLVYISGSSKLCFVQYFDETRGQMVTTFRLTTTALSDHSVIQTFELKLNETDILFALAKDNPCIAMVEHMMTRASYRAYYRVYRQLADQYGYHWVDIEESYWRVKWASSQEPEFKKAFLKRLTTPVPLSTYCEMDVVYCRLPCGHEISSSVEKIAQMSEQDCKIATCNCCGASVLSTEELLNVEIALESIKCSKLARFHAHWTVLDRTPVTEYTFRFDGKTLYAALKASLKGFASSELVSPQSLSISKHPTILMIMTYLREKLVAEKHMIEEVPKTLIETMIEDVMENVRFQDNTCLAERILPPGYIRFLHAWILRTVNFVTDRQCISPACDLGVHRHEYDLFYRSIFDGIVMDDEVTSTIDGVGAEMPSNDSHENDMNMLMAEMGDINLRGDKALHAGLDSMTI